MGGPTRPAPWSFMQLQHLSHGILLKFDRTKAEGRSSVSPSVPPSPLAFWPPSRRGLHIPFKSQGHFPPSFFWCRSSWKAHPQEHSPAELLAVLREAGRLLFPEGRLASPPQLGKNIEPFTAAQGQPFSPRDNQEFTGTRFSFFMD